MMDREKVLCLYDYFQREISPLLNPGGRNKSSAIATKINSVILNSKRHNWGIEEDIEAIRKIVYQKITKYEDEELTMWYSDLKAMNDEDTQRVIGRVISFYIKKNLLTKEEREFYKTFQNNEYLHSYW